MRKCVRCGTPASDFEVECSCGSPTRDIDNPRVPAKVRTVPMDERPEPREWR